MQFNENAEGLTSTGDKLGRIDRVIIDPKSKELTHLVVKKGILFTTDKVRLSISKEFVEGLPEYSPQD